MPKVIFSQTREVNDGTGTKFEAGETYELPTASCERWIKRGAASYAEGSGPVREPRQSKSAQRRRLRDITVDVSGEGKVETGAGESGPVEIPAGWADLTWTDLLALAKQFDAEVRTKEDAVAAVELEIERRKAE